MKELLVEWVGRLISLIDINSQFYSRFKVHEISEVSVGYHLKGNAFGERIDLQRHDTRTEVKAMTYADMRIDRSPEKIALWFTLDL